MTLELTAFVKLSASIDSLTDQMAEQKKLAERIHALLDHIPQDYPLSGSATTNSSGFCVFSCAGPDVGRQWQVRNIVVGGATKGTISFYRGATAPLSGQLMGLMDTTKTRWPAPAFYGTHQFVLNPRERLWVMVATATATAQVAAFGTAEDYNLAAYKMVETL